MRPVLEKFLRTAPILTAFALAACGQRGPLYLPNVPPLPPPPNVMGTAPAATAAPDGSTAPPAAARAQ